MFAATVGNLADYTWEAKILERASELEGGDIVGIAQQERLPILGQLASNPLEFTFKLDPQNPEKRVLTASLRFAFTVTSERRRDFAGEKPPAVSVEPVLVLLLKSPSEVSALSGYAFGSRSDQTGAYPHVNLFVGATEIINQSDHKFDAPGRRERIDLLVTHLASLAAANAKIEV